MKTDEITRVLQGRMEFDVPLFGPEELRLIEHVNQAAGDLAHGIRPTYPAQMACYAGPVRPSDPDPWSLLSPAPGRPARGELDGDGG